MAQHDLLKLILNHLKRSKEGRYAWSQRVMGDKTFLWKLANQDRAPYRRTVTRIKQAIARKENSMKALAAQSARRRAARRG